MRARRIVIGLLLLATAAMAATVRLYTKDGEYHLVREYKVEGDRVKYYSTERGEWEEMPLDLVDLKKTESEMERRKAEAAAEAKILDAEDRAIRANEAEIARVPQGPGVHWVDGKKLVPVTLAESKVKTNKRRSVLKVMSPIPLVTGKATVELDGETSKLAIVGDRPEFYIRLSADQRFGIVKLTPSKGVRIVEKVTIMPVTNETVEEPQLLEIFRQQVDDGLYKIWAQKAMEPGEYAVVEYTDGKVNLQVWDFTLKAPAK